MILSVTLPFFALIFLGFVAARLRWVPTEAVPAFNGFLLYFAVPALLFRFASNTPFRELTNLPFFAAWGMAGVLVVLVVTFIAHRVLHESRRDAAFFGLTGAVANAGFLGVPMLVALLGERAAAPVILAIVADLVIVASAGLALAEMGGATGRGWREDIRDAALRIFLNPFVISMVLGAAFSGFGWTLVTPASEIVKLLADAAGPCALFAIGVSLVRPDATLKSPALALPIAAKLLLHPAIVWVTMHLFGIDEFTTTVAVLVAALPSAGWVFIFAIRYEADVGRVSATILLTTALAFLTFSALVWLLGIGG
ncbi:MAG: AEC family transporter [Pseudomonadota bacterium]|nr:AEC family transporter [Pseudomonadota bacterium]